ncbi:MAG: bifunctional glutamate N-acetyltransferase/amino-acid acetyltransferase ArgJ [Anaerolineae bacterium]|nr:bifunctional glutamate N-acetyltransferase/amino-acid acetyltransferase ArgJ [Anaerolineae bacterium]
MTLHTPNGFRIAGTHCGLKPDERKDIALLVSDHPCVTAGVFTTNKMKAAPVLYDMDILAQPDAAIRAVLANTGSANACTGDPGLVNARQSAKHVADRIGCTPDNVLTLSTGVIGLPLNMDAMKRGIITLADQLSQQTDPAAGWQEAATAIMTTDTRPKIASVQGKGYTITGITKGAGMIAPNMATMLAIIATDAAIPHSALTHALRQATAQSFNRIVVDGDMSTNDTVLLLANGAAGGRTLTGSAEVAAFTAALTEVCVALAQAIVRDGEGATKFVTLQVAGATDTASARQIAQAIATSALVKTAFYGADPNWGRILAAAGYSGVDVDPARVALWLLDAQNQPAIHLVESGTPLDYDEPAAIALMQTDEWGFRLDLGLGPAEVEVWTCDLSHEYVTINGHYRT